MRNMTGAAKARVMSEMYREKIAGVDSRASRAGREWPTRDAEHDALPGDAGAAHHAQDEAG
jgi:hypothetical protein